MVGPRLEWEPTGDGAVFRLIDDSRVKVPVSDWSAFSSFAPNIVSLLNWLDDGLAWPTEGGLVLGSMTISKLDEQKSRLLGLPEATPFFLNIENHGRPTDGDFRLAYSWMELETRPAFGVSRIGAFIRKGTKLFRLPSPIYDIVALIDLHAGLRTPSDADRFRWLAELEDLLPGEIGNQIRSRFLGSFKIVYAAAFSLRLQSTADGFNFDPVLFGKRVSSDSSGIDEVIDEAQGLLPPVLQEKFARERFPAYADCRDRYAIGQNYYVYVDEGLQRMLGVVRKKQQAGRAERTAFAKNPRAALKEALGESFDESQVERTFVETEQFSQRVLEVGLWIPPVLSWLVQTPNTWLPERFGLQIGSDRIELKPEDLLEVRGRLEASISRGEEAIEFNGQRIPSTTSAIEAIDRLTSIAAATKPPSDTSLPEGGATDLPEEVQRALKHVLIIKGNYEQEEFQSPSRARVKISGTALPPALHTPLKDHQVYGLEWLRKAWEEGAPGVLLADDMGLGKTLQTLSFLAFLKAHRTQVPGWNGPFLVVAPTGLLNNWEKEHASHLTAPGLGEPCRVYGANLKRLKQGQSKDILTGLPSLDTEVLRTADWVLTTYETLNDYQHSFAVLRFPVAVFDEIQRIKNPAAQITCAAKGMNIDFAVGLTGTPVENRLEDLWSIMDRIRPLHLGDLKSFSRNHKAGDLDALGKLKSKLMDSDGVNAPVMLRRLKRDQLKGLPTKHEHFLRSDMPPPQADAYLKAVRAAKEASGPTMLETLHRLRSISLHPFSPSEAAADVQRYVASSARLSVVLNELDKVAKRNEKALIFLESLELQEHLSWMIKDRYQLDSLPLLINGQVAGPKRQPRVDEFQKDREHFGVMILSPRAGGVGLTLTSANHVFHLSRWWNPAVEDQCTDRVYRIGQDKDVHVYYPIAISPEFGESSFDVTLSKLLERKRQLSQELLAPQDADPSELRGLFEETIGQSRATPFSDVTLTDIDLMEPIQFEHWVIDSMRRVGFKAQATPMSNDGGADVIAEKDGRKFIVQCKHRQSNVHCDAEPIHDLLRAREHYKAYDSELIAITNAKDFTSSANRLAVQHRVYLVSRSQLAEWPRGCI